MEVGLGQEIQEYLRILASGKKANPATIAIYKRRLDQFSKHFSHLSNIENFTLADLESYTSALSSTLKSGQTYNQHVTTLKGFFRFLEKTRGLADFIHHFKCKTILQKEPLADESIALFLQNLSQIKDPRKIIFYFYIMMGVNTQKIAKLRKEDVRLEKDTLLLKIREKKKEEEIAYDLSNSVYAAEMAWCIERLKTQNKIYFVETGRGKSLSLPHFVYLLKKVKHLIPEPCHSIIELRSPSFALPLKNDSLIPLENQVSTRYTFQKLFHQTSRHNLYLVVEKENNHQLLCKVLSPTWQTAEDIESFKAEFNLLKALSHASIPRAFDYEVNGESGRHSFTLEFFPEKALSQLLGKLDHRQATVTLVRMTKVLAYLQANGVIHHDVSPANILVQFKSSGEASVRLVDFGLATQGTQRERRGTSFYMAPELVLDKPYTESVDIYSLALSIYMGLMKEFPFSTESTDAFLQAVANKNWSPPPEFLQKIPKPLADLLIGMMDFDPSHRLCNLQEIDRKCEAILADELVHREHNVDIVTLSYPALIGRDFELSTIKRDLQLFALTKPDRVKKIFIVSGEKGIGKRRLLAEAASFATLSEIQVCELSILANDPLASLVTFCKTVPKFSRELAREGEMEPASARSVFLGNLVKTFSEIITQKPTVIILHSAENLAKGGEVFWSIFLAHLSASSLSLLLFMELNTDERGAEKLVALTQKKIHSGFSAAEFPLSRFNREEIQRFLVSSLNRIVDSQLVNFIMTGSGGNPSYAWIILNDLVESKSLILRAEAVHFDERKNRTIPANIESAVRERLLHLTPEAKLVLFILSEFQLPINLETLKNLLQRAKISFEPSELIQSLSHLIKRNLIGVNKSFPNENLKSGNFFQQTFSVAFDLSAKILRDLVPLKRQKDLFLAMAEVMVEHLAFGEKPLEPIARFFLLAQDRENALKYYQQAGAKYLKEGRVEKALEMFRTLDAHIGALDSREKKQQKFGTLVQITEIDLDLGNFEELSSRVAFLQKIAESVDQRVVALKLAGIFFAKIGKQQEALVAFDQALAILATEKSSLPSQFTKIHMFKASSLTSLGRFEKAKQVLDDLASKASLTDLEKIWLKNQQGLIYYYWGEFSLSQKEFETSFILAQKEGLFRERIQSQVHLGLVAIELNQLEAAKTHFEEAMKDAERISDIYGKAGILQNLGNAYLKSGNLREAQNHYLQSLRIIEDLNLPRQAETILINLSIIYHELGNMAKARKYAQESWQLSQLRENQLLQGVYHSLMGDILFFEGDTPFAEKKYREAAALFAKMGALHALDETHLSLANLMLAAHSFSEARELIEKTRHLDEPEKKEKPLAMLLMAKLELAQNQLSQCKAQLECIDERDLASFGYQLQIEYYDILAQLKLMLGQMPKAEEAVQQLQTVLRKVEGSIPESEIYSFRQHMRVRSAYKTMDAIGNSNQSGDLRTQKLTRILEINLQLTQERDLSKLLENIIDNVILFSNAKRGFIFLKKGESYQVKAARNLQGENISFMEKQLSQTIVKATSEREQVLKVENALDAFAQSESVAKSGARSVLTLPIIHQDQVLGVIYCDDPTRVGAFQNIEQELLLTLARLAAIAISNSLFLMTLEKKSNQFSEKYEEATKQLLSVADERHRVEQILDLEKRKVEQVYNVQSIITHSPRMQKIFEVLKRLRGSDITVLITGESGTGKELIARSIHGNSMRAGKPFFAINCAAITESILESELFGYIRGAFTDAVKDKAGIFELANQGTLFLDEVGEMSLGMQMKFLRVLQEHQIRRVGGTSEISIDVRIICATNRNLEEALKEERFRQDLYYRLNGLEIRLPPLRERKEDIPLLVDHFINKYARERNIVVKNEVINYFLDYRWPGNIRQLENEMQKLIILAKGGVIDRSLLDLSHIQTDSIHKLSGKSLDYYEHIAIKNALAEAMGNKTQAAQILKVTRNTLINKMKKLGMD
jgi:transcriptional regulator with GAF, ATPase, and Fis domain/site-specific recombinase XerD/tRNA A-37 threonylcarbamoyl transferase component Bud32